MSAEEVKDQELADATPNNQGHGETVEESLKSADENPMPSVQKEEATLKKKYGGIIPKKPPLISKDHERAYFDSADWALGKQGAHKPKGPLEALRPKLQPTPHQQMRSRHASYSRADDVIDFGSNNTLEDDTMDVSSSDNTNTNTANEDPSKP